jgi:repressor LexA
MQGLTKRQREIIDFIDRYLAEKKHSPSYRDIQRHFNFSSIGSVYNHVQALKKRGILPTDTQRPRSIVLKEEDKTGRIEVPLMGMLRGGMPIETSPQVTLIPLAVHMVPDAQNCYLLRVVGNELNEEWIQAGDLLLVKSGSDFPERAKVLAQVGPQTTFVKRVITTPPYLRLESENPEVHPLILRKEHVKIIGVVLSLIRNYSS